MSTHNSYDALQSYMATVLGFMSEVNWMAVGAAVLLVARLVVDVPPAYKALRNYIRKQP